MEIVKKLITLFGKSIIEMTANTIWLVILVMGIVNNKAETCIIMIIVPMFMCVLFKLLKGFFNKDDYPKLHDLFYLLFLISSIFAPFRSFENMAKE